MNEPHDQLEQELANMRPRTLGPELAGRIESGIASGNLGPWADRLLLCAMGAGSLAACVIAVMLTMGGRPSLPDIHPTQTIAQAPAIGSYTLALARAGDDWIAAAK
jgi:hypothetical protein